MRLDLDERFARFALMDWWDQRRLARARIVVAGAGALGNEVVKNLALFGVGRMVVIDLDDVETSNLSRSVLFRPEDAGRPKAHAAARAARAIYPDLRVTGLRANLVHGVGLGLFRWSDLVFGALDNREARLQLNRYCYRVGRAWIDGAIESLSGIARVFVPPEGACYECTLGEQDWKLLEQRHSCSLLNRELRAFGKVPTTPSTASIIAGIQCQEAMKRLHGLCSLEGEGVVFDGMGHDSYRVAYPRNPDCLSHEPLDRVVETGRRAGEVCAREALGWAREALGPGARLEFARELLRGFDCADCGRFQPRLQPLDALTEADGVCPDCGARRAPRLFHSLGGGDADRELLDCTLEQLGLPAWDIVLAADATERRVGFELSGDRDRVLGECSGGDDGDRGASAAAPR